MMLILTSCGSSLEKQRAVPEQTYDPEVIKVESVWVTSACDIHGNRVYSNAYGLAVSPQDPSCRR